MTTGARSAHCHNRRNCQNRRIQFWQFWQFRRCWQFCQCPRQNLFDRGIRIQLARRDSIQHCFEFSRRKDSVFDVLHETLREQVAHAKLGACTPAAPLGVSHVSAETVNRRHQLGHAFAGRCLRLHDRWSPLARRERLQ